jgi:hypothetical protein
MPQYFFKYPKRLVNGILLTDLIARVKIADKYIDEDSLYYQYEFKDSDTAESIAHKYYKNPELHWIILITNQIFDANFDFPMSYDVFKNYILDKYKDAKAVSSLKIENQGSGYVDGYYDNVYLTIKNEETLDIVGSGVIADLTVGSGKITNLSVYRGGSNYDANTIFTINNSNLGGTGSGLELSILTFMDGIEYSTTTIHPEFGYQKTVKVTDTRTGEILSQQYYSVDENTYYNLYEGTDPFKKIVQLNDGTEIKYETIRSTLVTVYDYEDYVNEKKRNIKILKQEYFAQAVEEFVKLMSMLYV